jgi:hypothetical protein
LQWHLPSRAEDLLGLIEQYIGTHQMRRGTEMASCR